MSSKTVRALAGGSFVVSVVLWPGAAVFLVLAWDTPMRLTNFGTTGYAIVWSLVVGGVGAVLASRRPANPIGWIFCGFGLLAGLLAAQQQLVALQVRQRLAEGMIERAPDKARELMTQLQGDTAQALDDLRDLARGIYPPLLADKGLERALESQARKSPVPVSVESDSLGRYAQVVEAAVYFCALEALNNLAKCARASTATVSLSQVDGTLTFEVADDGVGFELASATGGTGLQGMADRLEAIGGTLEVDSAVGSGTIVRGRVPIGGAP